MFEQKTINIIKFRKLASTKQKEEREKNAKSEFDKSRSDYVAANREKINLQAGIEKVGGLIPCEVCLSTKTTHYQKQTRVSVRVSLVQWPLMSNRVQMSQ